MAVSDRKALFDIQAQKTDLRRRPEEQQEPEDEEELDVALEGAESEGEEMSEMWDTWDGQLSLSNHQEKNSLLQFPSSPLGGAPGRSKGLQERLEEQQELLGQLGSSSGTKPTTSLPHSSSAPSAAEATVRRDSKVAQVDLQDPGYETCGRSENEAEREDTSSPGSSDRPHLPPLNLTPAGGSSALC